MKTIVDKCMAFEVTLGFEEEIPNISHEAMVIMQPSIDINKLPHSFASMITNFKKNCRDSTYEQFLEFRIQGIQGVRRTQVNW